MEVNSSWSQNDWILTDPAQTYYNNVFWQKKLHRFGLMLLPWVMDVSVWSQKNGYRICDQWALSAK